jgi:hypothetical protein
MCTMNLTMSARHGVAPKILLAVVVAVSGVIGHAFSAPSRTAAEWCGPAMPSKVAHARGYLFTAVLVERRHQGVRPPAWDFRIERIHAGAGNVPPPGDPVQIRFEEGQVLTLYGGCYPPRGLRIGKRYLVSDGSLATFSSLEAVVWQIRADHRVRLLRQYGSKRMDPRFARPRTVAQAIALMIPRDELPPTDTAPARPSDDNRAASAIGAVVTWLLRVLGLRVG